LTNVVLRPATAGAHPVPSWAVAAVPGLPRQPPKGERLGRALLPAA